MVASSWIPAPVGVVWAVLFALVVLVHVGHAVVMPGRHRRWHASHVLMAAGMLVMFLPTEGMLVPAQVGVWVFALAAGGLAGGLVVARLRGAALGPLWIASVVDLAAMAYMFAMMSTRVAWLSGLAAAWFIVQALGWATGWLGRVLEHGGLGDTTAPTHRAGTAIGSPDREPDSLATSEAQPREGVQGRRGSGSAVLVAGAAVRSRVAAVCDRVVDGGRRDWTVRLTLTAMSVGMAYMLLAMQFGVNTMAGMSSAGMPGMSGIGAP